MSTESYGETVKEARAVRGWSMRRLADEAGVSEGAIRTIENGVGVPRPATKAKVDAALSGPARPETVQERDARFEAIFQQQEARRRTDRPTRA